MSSPPAAPPHAPEADVLAIARALVACPSVTPAAAAAFDVAAGLLSAAGFTVERMVSAEPGTVPVENLVAWIGEGRPHLAFAGHLDVVPPGDAAAWRHDPFSATVEDGLLHGRGTVDMKGGVAAFLAAALGFVADRGPDFGGRLSLLLTGDEEGPSVNGTRKILDWCVANGLVPDAAIVGEPTSVARVGDTIKIGRRGSQSGTVTARGRQGHVAYPERAANPLPALAAAAAALADPPLDGGTAHFAPSNLELVSIDVGNPSWNVVPAAGRLRFNVRYNDLWSRESLAAEIARRLAAVPADPDVALELALEKGYGDVFLTEPGPLVDTLAAAVADVTSGPAALSTGGGTSDARFLKDLCPVVELGLVGTTMHQIDERVPVADLERLAAIYRRFLDRTFGS